MNNKCLVEVAVTTLEHALEAEALGADRIELCNNLGDGGTTPSYGLIRQCVERLSIPVHVLIRSRPGHFHYSSDELAIMLDDIAICSDLGVMGVVFGFLSEDWTLDEHVTRQFTNRCHYLGLQTTFHRAIDVCGAPLAAIDVLAELGISNLLTSGGQKRAVEGIDQIVKYIERSQGNIKILPGGGITPNDVTLLREMGATQLHLSAPILPSAGVDQFGFGEKLAFNFSRVKGVINECHL